MLYFFCFLFVSSFSTQLLLQSRNNKIKVLKRNAYGYRNFKRFRNRILHMFSNKHISSATKQATA
nr:transposase [Ruminococcus bromii]